MKYYQLITNINEERTLKLVIADLNALKVCGTEHHLMMFGKKNQILTWARAKKN